MHIKKIAQEQPMGHTNINLDEALVAEAMRLTGTKTKREVVHLRLCELICLARLRRAREHRGRFHWQGDLEKMRMGGSKIWLDS
jgi:Arc/MetJ family transcription regulator